MRLVYIILIYLFSILIINSSFTCIRLIQRVSIDSIQYYKPKKIVLEPDDFKESSILLKLKDGLYTFYKDTTEKHHSFKAEKDIRNFYLIEWIDVNSIKDSSLSANIHYQAFDKIKNWNTSKIYNQKNVPIQLKSLKSFTLLYKRERSKVKGQS